MKNFGLKLFAALAIALAVPLFLAEGVFYSSVCNNKALWLIGTPLFVIGEFYAIFGGNLSTPVFGKPNVDGTQKSYKTVLFMIIAAAVAFGIQWWNISEC
jgi:hypothetical protein